jgi:hypothetical protein
VVFYCLRFFCSGRRQGGQILAAKVLVLADQSLAGVNFVCRDPEGLMLGQFEQLDWYRVLPIRAQRTSLIY